MLIAGLMVKWRGGRGWYLRAGCPVTRWKEFLTIPYHVPLFMPILVEVEVCLHSSSTARPSEVCDKVSALLERTTKGVAYTPGPIPLSTLKSDDFLARHVRHARICEILSPDAHGKAPVYLPSAGYWESELRM